MGFGRAQTEKYKIENSYQYIKNAILQFECKLKIRGHIMKIRRLFLILFVCYSTMLFGLTPPPEYIPMIISENQWNELSENILLPPEYQYQRTYITKIGSDTLIDGVSYYKLLTARDELSSIWLNNGYIREDVETRKVYYKPQKDEQEILLYNFNVLDMQVGNEMQSYDIQSRTNVLLSIGNVKYDYIGGENRMIATIRSTSLDVNCICYEDHIWIEGIGNMDGFLRSTMAIPLDGGDKMSLLCFFQNEELMYKPENTNIEDCFVYKLISSNIEILSFANCGIFPNPVDDILNISCLDNTILRIEIFDNFGRQVYSQTYKDTINVSSFSEGLYFLKAYDVNGQSSVFKIIKN